MRATLQDVLGSVHETAPCQATGAVSPQWMQGRTLYGGISAALCLRAARVSLGNLPPLRTAQFAFIGPASGEVRLQTQLLRRGRSSVYASVDLASEAGPGTRATFCFAAPRESALVLDDCPMPDVPPPEACAPHFPDGRGPAFAQHFDVRIAMGATPVSGADAADIAVWIRPHDLAAGPLDEIRLALGDVPPPAAMSMFRQPAPISSMTWSVDFANPDHPFGDGWHLARSTARWTREGSSVQTMGLWSRDGTMLMVSQQSVALFA